jgi:hypothetical protein
VRGAARAEQHRRAGKMKAVVQVPVQDRATRGLRTDREQRVGVLQPVRPAIGRTVGTTRRVVSRDQQVATRDALVAQRLAEPA